MTRTGFVLLAAVVPVLLCACDGQYVDVCEHLGQACRKGGAGSTTCYGDCLSRCGGEDPPKGCLYCQADSCINEGDCDPKPNGSVEALIPVSMAFLFLGGWRRRNSSSGPRSGA